MTKLWVLVSNTQVLWSHTNSLHIVVARLSVVEAWDLFHVLETLASTTRPTPMYWTYQSITGAPSHMCGYCQRHRTIMWRGGSLWEPDLFVGSRRMRIHWPDAPHQIPQLTSSGNPRFLKLDWVLISRHEKNLCLQSLQPSWTNSGMLLVLGSNPCTCDIHEAIGWICLPVMWMIDFV
jgi:hypothetical protein